jgi:transposase InsO family protein
VHAELLANGVDVSRKRVARIMTELGLRSRRKRRFKVLTPTLVDRSEAWFAHAL